VTHDALPILISDVAQVALMFQNLIGNAIKYRSTELPRVHVSATKNGGNVWTLSKYCASIPNPLSRTEKAILELRLDPYFPTHPFRPCSL
jgi:signal transduction histidine kinase